MSRKTLNVNKWEEQDDPYVIRYKVFSETPGSKVSRILSQHPKALTKIIDFQLKQYN